jgi:hypothetical protein
MTCYLHIGTPKTATKTIQLFLENNREQLKQDGFAYLRGKNDYRSFYRFTMLAYPLTRRDRYTMMEQISTEEEFKNFKQRVFSEIKAECTRTLGGRKDLSVIISSEIIQTNLVAQEDLLRLKEVLHGLGLDDIRIVVYLRNQPDFVNALFSTLVKMGEVANEPVGPEHPDSWVCDHRLTIERFSAVFGEKSIIPRLFHRSRLTDGCVIHDFCQAVGIPLGSRYVLPGNENESLSGLGASLLSRVNRRVPAFVNGKVNPLRGNIVGRFNPHFLKPKYQMPEELEGRYKQAFAASNEWVRQNYFPALTLLFPDEPRTVQVPVSATGAELDAIAGFLGEVWVHFNRCKMENKSLLQTTRRSRRVIQGLIILAVILLVACVMQLAW